jgi:hypothetical protein
VIFLYLDAGIASVGLLAGIALLAHAVVQYRSLPTA